MALSRGIPRGDTRGQAHIIELGAVGVVLILGVVVTIAVTGVTPGAVTAGVEEVNQTEVPIETQVEAATEASLSDGSLKRTLLLWDTSEETFDDGSGTPAAETRAGQFLGHPSTGFGKRLRAVEDAHDVRINVNAIPRHQPTAEDATGPSTRGERVRIIQRGTPDETARTVTVDLTLFDGDALNPPVNAHRTEAPAIERQTTADTTVADSGTYPIAEGAAVDDNRVYNTVTVEVVIWDE